MTDIQTVTISLELFSAMARIVDATVNAEECVCDEMVAGRCLYCRASEIQDNITATKLRAVALPECEHGNFAGYCARCAGEE